jgi:hypothetical protein
VYQEWKGLEEKLNKLQDKGYWSKEKKKFSSVRKNFAFVHAQLAASGLTSCKKVERATHKKLLLFKCCRWVLFLECCVVFWLYY